MTMKNLITEKIKELRVNYNVFKNVGNTEMLNIVSAKINENIIGIIQKKLLIGKNSKMNHFMKCLLTVKVML